MFQIDAANAALAMPALAAAGTPGWFQAGNAAAGTPPVLLSQDWLNGVQAELLNALEAANLAPAKTNLFQLAQSIALIGRRSYYVAGATDPNNNVDWVVPPGVFVVFSSTRGGGGDGGPGNQGSGGQSFAGGGGGPGHRVDGPIMVQPGDRLRPVIGARGNVASILHNGATVYTAGNGLPGGAASANNGGTAGGTNYAATFAPSGSGARFYAGSIGSAGYVLGANNAMSMGGVASGNPGPTMSSGSSIGGNAAQSPGDGGSGGCGNGFGGGFGMAGDCGWTY